MMPFALLTAASTAPVALIEMKKLMYENENPLKPACYIYSAGIQVSSLASNLHQFVHKYVVPKDGKGSPESDHEHAVGVELNQLRGEIPTFVYTSPTRHTCVNDDAKCKGKSGIAVEFCNTLPVGGALRQSKRPVTCVDLSYFISHGNPATLDKHRKQFLSILAQMVSAWAIAYERIGFVSNDAHIQNILVDTQNKFDYIMFAPKINGVVKQYYIRTHGVMARHIDYGLARTNRTHRPEDRDAHWTSDLYRLLGFAAAWATINGNKGIREMCIKVADVFPLELRGRIGRVVDDKTKKMDTGARMTRAMEDNARWSIKNLGLSKYMNEQSVTLDTVLNRMYEVTCAEPEKRTRTITDPHTNKTTSTTITNVWSDAAVADKLHRQKVKKAHAKSLVMELS